MKFLFIGCLFFLGLLNCLNCRAEETQTKEQARLEIAKIIELSQIPNKKMFTETLISTANKEKICPKLLFSLGIDQWDALSEKESIKQLKSLATYAKFLK